MSAGSAKRRKTGTGTSGGGVAAPPRPPAPLHVTRVPFGKAFYRDVLIFCAKPAEYEYVVETLKVEERRGSVHVEGPVGGVSDSLGAWRLFVGEAEAGCMTFGDVRKYVEGAFPTRRGATTDGDDGDESDDDDEVVESPLQPSGANVEELYALRVSFVVASGVRQGPEWGGAGLMGLLSWLQPRAVVMVGMTAADKEAGADYGDVMYGYAATNIAAGKRGSDGQLRRDQMTSGSTSAESFAGSLALVPLKDVFGAEVKLREDGRVLDCSYVCGPEVVESGFLRETAARRSDKAYDMESSAFFAAVELYNRMCECKGDDRVMALGVLKGVSDHADASSRDKTGEKKRQRDAVANSVLALLYGTLPVYAASLSAARSPPVTALKRAEAARRSAQDVETAWKHEVNTEAVAALPEGVAWGIVGMSTGLQQEPYVTVTIDRAAPYRMSWTEKSVKTAMDSTGHGADFEAVAGAIKAAAKSKGTKCSPVIRPVKAATSGHVLSLRRVSVTREGSTLSDRELHVAVGGDGEMDSPALMQTDVA